MPLAQSPSIAQRLKVLVAMSGGVDSSYVAAALAQEGHDVTGVTLRVWQDGHAAFDKSGPGLAQDCNLSLVEATAPAVGGKPSKSCCGAEDMRDARSVAQARGIPYYVLDYEDRFRQDVIDPFVAEYLAGRTPNPCVACND
jgi:tRNA-specific 2-thiouridylase